MAALSKYNSKSVTQSAELCGINFEFEEFLISQ